MKYKLYRSEIVFNVAMCYADEGNTAKMNDCIAKARKLATTSEQKRFIDTTKSDIFTVPLNLIFDVTESKKNNLTDKSYLQDGRVALDRNAAEPGFNGFAGAALLNPELKNPENSGTLVRGKGNNRLDNISNRSSSLAAKNDSNAYPSPGRTLKNESTRKYTRKSSLPEFRNSNRPYQIDRMPNPIPESDGSVMEYEKVNEFDLLAYEVENTRIDAYQKTQTLGRKDQTGYQANQSLSRKGDQIKLKINGHAIGNQSCMLMVDYSSIQIDQLVSKIQQKLKTKDGFNLAYLDEDTMVTIFDQEDLNIFLDDNDGSFVIYLIGKEVEEQDQLKQILTANLAWAEQTEKSQPKLFEELASGQSPTMLWIGCSDSRVPPSLITGRNPGEMFVHRNIGNGVYPMDDNANSVIEYSVEHLKVKDVIVCGHFGCGAVMAGMGGDTGMEFIEKWINQIRKIYSKYEIKMESYNQSEQVEIMCQINAIINARNACLSKPVQHAWKVQQPVTVHAWIYQLKNGRIKDLGFNVSRPEDIDLTTQLAIKKVFQSV
ncbi:carbonic anhydrase [Globomyces pollinis-pini]|nr:carbonic anhydrase [Globomyces pollinis-pini]